MSEVLANLATWEKCFMNMTNPPPQTPLFSIPTKIFLSIFPKNEFLKTPLKPTYGAQSLDIKELETIKVLIDDEH